MPLYKKTAPDEPRTDYPIHLHTGIAALFDAHATEILRNKGVEVSNVQAGCITLNAPSNPAKLRAALEEIPYQSLQTIFLSAASMPNALKTAIKQVSRFNALKQKMLSADPGFPLGGQTGFPYSWPYNDQIGERFNLVLSALKKYGITIQIGVELELSVTENPLSGYEDAILDFINETRIKEIMPKRAALKAGEITDEKQLFRLRQLYQFLPRDFLMFYLYEHDEIIQETFEYKFGKDSGGNGYYDNDNVFELTTHPQNAEEFFESYTRAQRHLLEKFSEFGFGIQGEVAQQLNMSFWRDGRNILLCQTPEDEALCARIFQSMGRMLENGHSLLIPECVATKQHDYPIISPSRASLARHAHGRIELKGFIFEAHHLLLGATLGAAAAYATCCPDICSEINENAKDLMRVTTCNITLPNNGLPWLRHAINGSTVNLTTGEITPDAAYIELNATKILHQMNPDDPAFIKPVKKPNDHIEAITLLISSAKIVTDGIGYKIQWPEGCALKVTDQTIIDMDLLTEHMRCAGVSSKFIYTAKSGETWKERIERARGNEIITLALGTELSEKIIDARIEDIKSQDAPALLRDFTKGITKAFAEQTVKDDGQGYVLLSVPIKDRSALSAEKGIKKLMAALREQDSKQSAVFKAISIVGMTLTQDRQRATAYTVRVPSAAYNTIQQYFVELAVMAALPDKKPSKFKIS